MSNLFKFAENILNNLDQSTQSSIQSALNKSSPSSSKQLKSKSHANNRPPGIDNDQRASTLLSSHSSASLKSAPNPSTVNQSSANAGFKSFSSNNSSSNLSISWHPKASNGNKDDELMDYLNSSDFSQLSSEPALNLNSKASLEINTNLDAASSPQSEFSPATNGGDLVQFSIGGGSDTKSKHSETEEDETASISGADVDVGGKKDNSRLKSEISSLNQEINSLMKRIKITEDGWYSCESWHFEGQLIYSKTENNRNKRKIDQYQSQVAQSDKIIRELRAREDDMNESLRSKDSQLAVLRVRFDELDGELKARQAELATMRAESERLLKDHSNSSDLQSQLVDTLKEKVNELETSLSREKEAYVNVQVHIGQVGCFDSF